jgi:hypothetical protein
MIKKYLFKEVNMKKVKIFIPKSNLVPPGNYEIKEYDHNFNMYRIEYKGRKIWIGIKRAFEID